MNSGLYRGDELMDMNAFWNFLILRSSFTLDKIYLPCWSVSILSAFSKNNLEPKQLFPCHNIIVDFSTHSFCSSGSLHQARHFLLFFPDPNHLSNCLSSSLADFDCLFWNSSSFLVKFSHLQPYFSLDGTPQWWQVCGSVLHPGLFWNVPLRLEFKGQYDATVRFADNI